MLGSLAVDFWRQACSLRLFVGCILSLIKMTNPQMRGNDGINVQSNPPNNVIPRINFGGQTGIVTNPQYPNQMNNYNTPWSPWDPYKQVVVGGYANPNILPVGGVQCYMCTAQADDCYTGDLCVGELCAKIVIKYPDGRATVWKHCVLSNPRAVVEQYIMYQDDTKTRVVIESLCTRSRCNGVSSTRFANRDSWRTYLIAFSLLALIYQRLLA